MIKYAGKYNIEECSENLNIIKNINIAVLHKKDIISCINVFNVFWKKNTNIIYVVDKDEHFEGIITDKALLEQITKNDKEEPFINKECIRIQCNDDNSLNEKAGRMFEQYCITSAIPVINTDGRLRYEIRKRSFRNDEEKIKVFREKVNRYVKSYYLKEELIYLKKILENQNIVVIGTEEQFDYMFGKLALNKKRIEFMEKLDNPYDFMYHMDSLLIDLSPSEFSGREDIYRYCNSGYYWKHFMRLIYEVIELGYCSTLYKIFDNDYITIYDFLKKYLSGNVYVSKRSIFSSSIINYLQKRYFKILTEKGLNRKTLQYNLKLNGIIINNPWIDGEYSLIQCVNIVLQMCKLNYEISDRAKVINIVFDDILEATDIEKSRMAGNIQNDKYNYEIERYSLAKNNGKEYLKEIKRFLQLSYTRNFENDRIVFKDLKSVFVNVENGVRETSHQPEEYRGTIYFFGGCTIWGTAVEDQYTIPSLIQEKINHTGKKYRVVNLGNNLIDASKLLESLVVRENDIFVCFFPFITDYVKKSIPVIEIGERFNKMRFEKYGGIECFDDMVQHCGTNGNVIYAEIIFEELKKYITPLPDGQLRKNNIYNIFRKNCKDLNALYNYDSYITELRAEGGKFFLNDDKEIGCIVMNSNPFTLGHRYLVEYALQIVDYLYLFVVEEDKSFFSFSDRLEMVKKGTEDLKGVAVVRSGNMIASSITFPAYFQKQEVALSNKKPSVGMDLRAFAQYIAPAVGIHYRFIGEEPSDFVTAEYNVKMKEILSEFGIQVIEIPRKCRQEGAITASKVRELYLKKDYKNMIELVPDTTLQYLKEKSVNYEVQMKNILNE